MDVCDYMSSFPCISEEKIPWDGAQGGNFSLTSRWAFLVEMHVRFIAFLHLESAVNIHKVFMQLSTARTLLQKFYRFDFQVA